MQEPRAKPFDIALHNRYQEAIDGLDAPIPETSIPRQRLVSRRMPPPPPTVWQRAKAWLSAALCVWFPTVVAAIFLCGFATDQYVSEAKFVVCGASGSQLILLSGMLSISGISRA